MTLPAKLRLARFVLLILLLWLLACATSAIAAAPTLDSHGTCSRGATGTADTTCTITTIAAKTIVYLTFQSANLAADAATITNTISGCGLTWNLRKTVVSQFIFSAVDVRQAYMTTWWASATAVQAGCTVTLSVDHTSDATLAAWVGVAGVASAATPFDANAGFPFTALSNQAANGNMNAAITTSNKNDLIYQIAMSENKNTSFLCCGQVVLNSATAIDDVHIGCCVGDQFVDNWWVAVTSTKSGVSFGTNGQPGGSQSGAILIEAFAGPGIANVMMMGQ